MPTIIAPPLEVTAEQLSELQVLANSTGMAFRTVRQAKALLDAAGGVANEEIARRAGASSDTVRSWRRRFADKGVSGVGRIAKGRGRKPFLPDGTVAEIVRVTQHELPEDGTTHWTTRTLAARFGVGKDTIARTWRDNSLKPWQQATFKLSDDPEFEDKLVDVVGLYMDPPKRAVVFSFDEKTQVPGDGPHPAVAADKPGRAGTMTHDYKRNGTIDLFAALNVGTGEVITHTRKSHTARRSGLLQARRPICAPSLADTRRARQPLGPQGAGDPGVARQARQKGRWHLHYTPTSSSWVNLVERWFRELTDKRLRRAASQASHRSSLPSSCGRPTGTPAPSPSSGTRPPKRSSRKCLGLGRHFMMPRRAARS